MDKVPYPARRRYPWALPHISMTYTGVVSFFKAKQRQCPREKNPARFDTYALMLECIDELNHQGVEDFAGPKLHKLLIKCADRCGWHTDVNQVQRSLVPRLVEGTLDVYTCPHCGKDKHRSSFMGLMTQAQKEKYNKPEKSRALIMQKRCAECRDNANEAQRRRQQRIKSTVVMRNWAVLAASTRGLRGGDLYVRYGEAVRRSAETVRRALRRARAYPQELSRALPRARIGFYERKLELLALCAQRLDERVESADFEDLKQPEPMWIHLLTADERAEIHQKYARMLEAERLEAKACGLPRRTPPILEA